MTVCLPDDLTTKAARINLLAFINSITQGNPSDNKDGGDWVAYLSLAGPQHLCHPDAASGKGAIADTGTGAPYTVATRKEAKGSGILVTSTVDGLTVNKLTVNGGSCDLTGATNLPATLNSGQSTSFSTSCGPVKVELETNKGNWTTTWKE